MTFIQRNIARGSTFEGIYRKDRWEYPLSAIREALINAVIHRDYSLSGRDIKVAIYDDMLEITSPGDVMPFQFVKKNAPSTIQVLIKKASHVPYAQEIIEYYQTERTREEIQKYIKINNRKYFRESILNPLLELSVIRMTIPDKPNSSKQKYITVEEEAKNE